MPCPGSVRRVGRAGAVLAHHDGLIRSLSNPLGCDPLQACLVVACPGPTPATTSARYKETSHCPSLQITSNVSGLTYVEFTMDESTFNVGTDDPEALLAAVRPWIQRVRAVAFSMRSKRDVVIIGFVRASIRW